MPMVTGRYFSKWPPTASAMSPKQQRIGGFTSRLSDGFCALPKSSATISSQYGMTLDSRARQMSPTTPTAMAQTWCSSELLSPRLRKGRKCGMYLSKLDSVALAMAPTAMSASSWTVEFLDANTCKNNSIMRSAKGTERSASFAVTTCSEPQSSPCSSVWASRSSAETICMAKVCSSLWQIAGSNCSMWPMASRAALVMVVLSASYAEMRKLCSLASARSAHASSARASSTKRLESTLVASLR
mmetsp:Transcript_19594/g.45050  ORF Transcript_19594/g.45050 Transcript_19594/m.45050 type:complete len:243 (-) Transcript_19594:1570-2298(-)